MTLKEIFMKTKQFLMIAISAALFAGCATMPPNELVNARSAYRIASEGQAAALAPAELRKAQTALNLAEQSFVKEPDSARTKDLSYAAQRRAELASAVGAMAADVSRKDRANANFEKKQTEIIQQGKQDLRDSERQTAYARAELARIGAVKEEERGLVVTLSGSVLFRSDESTLLTSAQVKLDQVAKALLAVRERNIIVEGHTDSQSSASYNQDLSQRRADTVRNYLIGRGYPANRMQALGMGEGSPIADNTSPEGRANNRRVEIVIIKRAMQSSSR